MRISNFAPEQKSQDTTTSCSNQSSHTTQ